MKLRIFILYIATVAISSCSNGEISPEQADSFIKFYGTENRNLGEDIKPLPDEGYALLGSIVTPDNGSQIYLAKTNKFGNLRGEPIVLGGPFADYGYAMQISSNGTVYIVGSTVTERSGTSDMVLYIVTETEVTGPLTFGTNGNEVGYHLQITETGIVMVGFSDVNGSKDIYLVLANRNGNEIWSKQFGHLTGEDIGRFVLPYGNHYLITGSTNYDNQLNVRNNKNIWLLEIAPENRSPVNSLFIGGDQDDEGVGLLAADDGSVYLAGTVINDDNESGIYLAHIDQTLKITWERSYHDLNSITTSGICKWNNNIVISGTNVINENSSRVTILWLNENGEMVKDFHMGGDTRLSASSVEMAPDAGLIIIGTNENRGASMITFIKLNEEGNL